MDVTHANENREELRFIPAMEKFDSESTILTGAELTENSFLLTVPDSVWGDNPIYIGHCLYVDGTEYGGVVKKIAHDTSKQTVTVSGLSWRGMLKTKRIEPPTGQAYYTASGEANAVIAAVAGGLFGDLVRVSSADSGVSISVSWRFEELHDALESALESVGFMLSAVYSSAQAALLLSARAIIDNSGAVDLSQDYGLPLKSYAGRLDNYNHIIALGAGELLQRDILHVYRLDDGTITTTAPVWVGTNHDVVAIYDYTNPETDTALLTGATKKLKGYAPLNGVEIDPDNYGVTLLMGDIVGARDRLTGLSGTARVVGKILTIDKTGVAKIETKVG